LVIWFHPNDAEKQHAYDLASHFDFIIIIDNTNEAVSELEYANHQILYVPLGTNKGIAAALNYGCQLAVLRGYEYVLTLDQDSTFNTTELKKYLASGKALFARPEVAMLGVSFNVEAATADDRPIESETLITSGCLLRLCAWSLVGRFNENLFIDQVDHEFCYRLKEMGSLILHLPNILLNHQTGEPVTHRFLNKELVCTNHNALRRYYQARNTLYVRKRFPAYAKPRKKFFTETLFFLISITFESDRISKLIAICLGVLHFYCGRDGKLTGVPLKLIHRGGRH
jgi:rhamnosyltransferase